MAVLHKLWVEKYRPHTIDQYVFQNPTHAKSVKAMIEDKSIPHLLFAGVRGTGKTTLARILIDAIGVDPMDVYTANASDKRGIEVFRNEIKSFAETAAIGAFKVVYLEEADQLTPDAQKALKSFTEDSSDYLRFIFTTNHANKMIIELRSRCQEFFFKASPPDDIAEYVVTVLAAEKVKFKLDLVDKYVAAGWPDVRKIVNLVQQNTINGVLQEPSLESIAAEYKLQLLDMLSEKKWSDARQLVCGNVAADQWEDFFRFMYENVHKVPTFGNSKEKWEEAIVLIADYLYKHSLVADPEINAAALIIRLSMVK